MKRTFKNLLIPVLFIFVAALTACSDDDKNDNQTQGTLNAKIMVISDLHVMDPSLLIADGTAFQTYLASDRKMLKESVAITQSMVNTIIAQKPSILLVAGDLTKDGEKVSHEKVASILQKVKDAGIKVYVICGNHDVNNPYAVSFNGETTTAVDQVNPDQFKTIYKNFGYDAATESDPNSLSYVVEPMAGLTIVVMDVCKYNPHETAGAFTTSTLAWSLAQVKKAKAKGNLVLGMLHHGMVEHYTGQKTLFSEYVIDDWESVSKSFVEAGLNMVFTGHYHAQDIRQYETGSGLMTDIETGSAVTWPCPIRSLSITGKKVSITSEFVTTINYDLNGVAFQDYAKSYLTNGMVNLAGYMLMSPPYNVPAEYIPTLAPAFANAFVAHYHGDESPTATDMATVIQVQALNADLGNALGSLWTDLNPSDNTTEIVLP
ncbi:MAG: metallophosphoesterase [Sphingobacteriia bacterium]|nr:metallophosphoesterase [Sphingobacteriia bacterium]